jgi:hypothetical protein
MATKSQNRLRPQKGRSTVYQSQNPRTSPTNNSKGIPKRYFDFINIKRTKSTYRRKRNF